VHTGTEIVATAAGTRCCYLTGRTRPTQSGRGVIVASEPFDDSTA